MVESYFSIGIHVSSDDRLELHFSFRFIFLGFYIFGFSNVSEKQCALPDVPKANVHTATVPVAQTGRLILCTHLWKSINVAVKNSVAAFILINEANQEEMAGFWANIYSYSWHAVDIQTFIYTNVLTLIFPDKMFMCCLSWISSDSF